MQNTTNLSDLIISQVFPNWNKKVEVTVPNNATAGNVNYQWKIKTFCYGLFQANPDNSTLNRSLQEDRCHIWVNDAVVVNGQNRGRGQGETVDKSDDSFNFIPLKEGDVVKFDFNRSRFYLIPCKFNSAISSLYEVIKSS